MVAAVAQRYRWPLLAIAAAWLVAIWAEASGVSVSFHHDHLAAGSLPLWAGALLLLGAWQVMTIAMMLPSSLPLVRMYTVASRGKPERLEGIVLFLGAYFAVWSMFALFAFFGDAACTVWSPRGRGSPPTRGSSRPSPSGWRRSIS